MRVAVDLACTSDVNLKMYRILHLQISLFRTFALVAVFKVVVRKVQPVRREQKYIFEIEAI